MRQGCRGAGRAFATRPAHCSAIIALHAMTGCHLAPCPGGYEHDERRAPTGPVDRGVRVSAAGRPETARGLPEPALHHARRGDAAHRPAAERLPARGRDRPGRRGVDLRGRHPRRVGPVPELLRGRRRGLVYFSGHGVRFGTTDYLPPSDVRARWGAGERTLEPARPHRDRPRRTPRTAALQCHGDALLRRLPQQRRHPARHVRGDEGQPRLGQRRRAERLRPPARRPSGTPTPAASWPWR